MKRFLLILAACSAVLLASCDKEAKAPELKPGEVSIETTAADASGDTSNTIVIEDERITITSLENWQAFNHDGNFSDNCLEFLRNFIQNDSEYFEFNTVHLGEWEIIRDPEIYGLDLAFNFTVTASELDAIPVGEYQTIVNDAVDCTMQFVQSPRVESTVTAPSSAATETVSAWLTTALCYDFYSYGEWKNDAFRHYLCTRYADASGKLLYADFETLAKEKFGADVQKEDYLSNAQLYIENNKLYITSEGGNMEPCFDIVSETVTGDVSTVTVQFYADCNKFLQSYTAAYRIDSEDRLLGCEILKTSPYKPYCLHSVYGN